MRGGSACGTARRFAPLLWAAPVLLGLCLLAAGCGGSVKSASDADLKALEATAAAPPKLQVGEKIGVTVYGEASLSGTYQIDPSGYVSLPLGITVKAAGLTQRDLEQELEKQFSAKYLNNPKITVSIVEFSPFYIAGEVEKPGQYPYMPGLNVMSAIAIAGGKTYRANQSNVLIQHLGENSLREYDATSPIPILPGDILQVPRRYF